MLLIIFVVVAVVVVAAVAVVVVASLVVVIVVVVAILVILVVVKLVIIVIEVVVAVVVVTSCSISSSGSSSMLLMSCVDFAVALFFLLSKYEQGNHESSNATTNSILDLPCAGSCMFRATRGRYSVRAALFARCSSQELMSDSVLSKLIIRNKHEVLGHQRMRTTFMRNTKC